MMGEPEWSAPGTRTRPTSAAARTRQHLDELISQWTATLDAEELLELMDAGGVPAGRIYKAADMLADPHFKARESIVQVPDQKFGTLKMQNVVPKLSATPGSIRWTGAGPGPAQRRRCTATCSGIDEAKRAELAANGSSDAMATNREDDYAGVGFRGRIGFGDAPGGGRRRRLSTAYLEGGPLTDAGGRFESARASTARVVDAARAAGHPVLFTTVRLAPGRRRRRLVRRQGARPERLRGRARRTPPSPRRPLRGRARSW